MPIQSYGVPGSGSGASGGTPALVLSTSNAAGSASTFIRTDDQLLAFDATAPTTQAFSDAAAAGSAATGARRDHKHAWPALGTTPSTQAFSDAAAGGSDTTPSKNDHKHAWPALGTTAAAVGTSAGGSATTPSKSDHVHATGAGTPSTQLHGDAAATGTGPAASMTDHKHALANLSGDVTTTGSMVTTLAAGSASNLNSGTLPAGRLPALTGNVTTSAGSAATTIAAAVVTPAMMATRLNNSSGTTAVGDSFVAVGTADITKNNNSTLADCTGLSFAIAANERWWVEMYVIVAHASANADAKFGLTAPASCTADWGLLGAAGGTVGGYGGWPSTSSGVVVLTISGTLSLGGVAGDVAYSMGANIANSSTGGTIQLQFAQVTNTVENTILRGSRSLLVCRRLA